MHKSLYRIKKHVENRYGFWRSQEVHDPAPRQPLIIGWLCSVFCSGRLTRGDPRHQGRYPTRPYSLQFLWGAPGGPSSPAQSRGQNKAIVMLNLLYQFS